MTQYSVTGMSCAACSARVEKAVSAVPGVTSCAVSLLTNSMGVDGTAAPADIVRAVENAGYGASLKGAKDAAPAAAADELADHETPKLKKRLISSVAVLLVLMYFSMGHMWGAPMPRWLHHNSVGMGLIQLLLAGIVLVINQNFFISGFRSAVKGAPNMDTLIAMGSAAAYLWSVYELFTLTVDPMAEADLYFESAAMILTLITVGKTLEAHSKGKTTDALRSLMQLSPKTARLERNGKEVVVPAEEVVLGDIFLVRPGDSIPVDGVVLSGASAVNESALTGESLPVDKAENDKVSAGTINQSSFLRCRATGVGEDTALSQIIRMVSDAAATKAPIAKTADKVAGVFVPTVIGIAAVTIIVWLLVGQTFGYALARGISVLVISCPCALGLATPVAIMVGSGVGAKNGILFKTAASLEETGRTQIVVLDKTGTITTGQPEITDLLPADGVSEDELLRFAAALESKSEHPLSRAILNGFAFRGGECPEAENFAAVPGRGLTAKIEGYTVCGGNADFIPEKTSPYEFYQYWRNVADADVLKCIRMLTFLPLEEIDKMDEWEGSQLNTAKEILAFELTKLVHGEKEAQKAQAAARAIFAGGGSHENMPSTKLSDDDFKDGKIGVLDMMVKSGLAVSKGEGRRLVIQGGVSINGDKITDPQYALDKAAFENEVIMKKGKKVFHKFEI